MAFASLRSCDNNSLWSGYHAEGRTIAGVWIRLFSGAIIVMIIIIMTTVCYQTAYYLGKQCIRHDKGYTCFKDFNSLYVKHFIDVRGSFRSPPLA